MAHFAQIDKNNIVQHVIVVDNLDAPDEATGQKFIASLGFEGKWLETSYDTLGGVNTAGGVALRKNFASIGFTYDEKNDAFYAPQPFPSWVLDTTTFLWSSPTPPPSNDKAYTWDEPTLSWKESSI
jgi:hypothetical protein